MTFNTGPVGPAAATPPPKPPDATPPAQAVNPPPQAGINRLAAVFRRELEDSIQQFSSPRMGGRLFIWGIGFLAFDIVVRLLQWGLIYLRWPALPGMPQIALPGGAPAVSAGAADDVFFIGLLCVSVLMMAGGLVANLYLIWSVERTQLAAAQAERESMRMTSAVDSLQPKPPQG